MQYEADFVGSRKKRIPSLYPCEPLFLVCTKFLDRIENPNSNQVNVLDAANLGGWQELLLMDYGDSRPASKAATNLAI
jgi:hypothetical protein